MILCTTCGTRNEDSASFCTSCNGYLAWVGKPLTPEPAAEPTPTTEAAAPSPVERPRVNTVELGRSEAPTPSPVVERSTPSPVDPDAVGAVVPALTPPQGRARPPAASPTPAAPVAATAGAGAPPSAPPAGGAASSRTEESGAACPSCGAGNAATRRFCRRCGTPLRDLVTPAAEVTAVDGAKGSSWWSRMWGGDGRDARRQGRMAYNAALGLRAQVFRVVMILAALGIGISMAPPWGGDVRGWGFDQLDRLRPATYDAADVKAVVLTGAPELEGFASTFAVDGEPTRAWATPWDPAAPPLDRDAECPAAGAAAGQLQVDFTRPVRIDRVSVRAGLDRENPNWATQARPRVLDLVFSDQTCKRVVLEDAATVQRLDVGVRDVSSVIVRVVDAFPAREGPGQVVAISELAFEAET